MLKYFLAAFFICSISYSQSYYTFSDLQGLTDKNGKVYLFYRLNAEEKASPIGVYGNRSIYKYDTETGIETLFLEDKGWITDDYHGVDDYEFIEQDVNRFYYAGYNSNVEAFPFLHRYNSEEHVFNPHNWSGSKGNVELSRQDTDIVFVSFGIGQNYVSTDYGNTWDTIAPGYQLLSISPFNHNKIFAWDYLSLYLSEDMGETFDTISFNRRFDGSFLYDMDNVHIYSREYGNKNSLSVYNGTTWNIKYSSFNEIFISMDPASTGNIFVADGREIYSSQNYGEDFTLFKSFDADITGIYKNPGVDVLYVLTEYDLFELKEGSISLIKHLDSGNLLDWYPLVRGNKWYYDYELSIDTDYVRHKSLWELTDFIQHSEKSFVELSVLEKTSDGLANIRYNLYLEFDTTEQKVYVALESGDSLVRDILIGDFSMDKGDTIHTGTGAFFTCSDEGNMYYLGKTYRFKKFYNSSIMTEYTFIRGVGLQENMANELSLSKNTLYGAVINGVIIGDTLLTDVNPENIVIHEFSLGQNYPNPFNPITTIKYAIKERSNVSLKVYDILGKEVATLVNEEKPAGDYEVTFNGSNLSSGVYIYRITSGEYSHSKKLLLLK